MPSGIVERWARDYFLDVTTAGGIDALLEFDFAAAGLAPPAAGATYELLYRSSLAGPFGNTGVFGTNGGGGVAFALDGMSSATDGYFTIGLVPEPATAATLGTAAGAVALTRSNRRRQA